VKKVRRVKRLAKQAAPPLSEAALKPKGALLRRFLALPFPFFRWQRVNLPNQLTLLRMLGLPFFIALFLSDSLAAQWASLVFFGLLAFTDWLDGYLARKLNQVTNFGKIMDPLADKLLMLTAMICFVQIGLVPGWMIVVIWWRELAITGLRTLAATRRSVMAADNWGKAKTVLQVAAVISGMVVYILQNTLNSNMADWRLRLEGQGAAGEWAARILDTNAIPYWLMFGAMVLSLFSGIRYFSNNWEAVCLELESAERSER
jgi:CDP-diacylglycerol--glycerol-3-phosphate 3-phosphatidyltransferase